MKKLFCLLALCNIMFSIESFSAEFIVATEDLAQLKKTYSVQDFKPMFLGANKFPRLQKYYLVNFSELYQIGSLKQSLSKKEFVLSATENVSFEFHNLVASKESLAKRSDFYPYQWALENTGQYLIEHPSFDSPVSIKGKSGFDFDFKFLKDNVFPLLKKEVLVAVVDSGIDLTHPDLNSRVYESPDQCGIPLTEPSDNKPFPNDCRGYNFVAPHYTKQGLVTDYYGHGTHTSGIIAANDDDGIGVSGISPVAKILPAKVYLSEQDLEGFEEDTVNNVSTLSVYVAQAIYYSIIREAKIINLSLGWPPVLNIPVMKELMEIADDNDIIVVASSGNDSSFSQVKPCAYKSVVCVGAMGIQGEYASWSNYGAHIDFAAPGTAILSTFPNNKSKRFPVQLWEYMDGSSQSGPYIAGLFSILKSLYPNASKDELYERMYRSSVSGYPYSLSLKPDVKLFLKEMNELPPRVYFDLKENNRIFFNKEARGDLRLSYEIFGGDVSSSELKISLSDPGVEIIGRTCKLNGRRKDCVFQLRANFENASQVLKIELQVVQGDLQEKALAIFHMGRNLDEDFSFDLGQKRNDGFVSPENYHGIQSMMGISPGPFYFGVAKKDDFRRLEVVNFEKDGKLEFSLDIDEKQEVSAVYLGDFNYDSERDFLIVLSARVGDDYDTGREYLYLKRDGSRLFPEYGKMKLYDPRIGIDSLNINSLSWMKYPISKKRSIAMPAFWANRKYFTDHSLNPIYGSPVMHPFGFYTLEPKQCESKICLKPRLLDNNLFYFKNQKLQKDMSETLWINSIVPLNPEERESDYVAAIFLSGYGAFYDVIEVRFFNDGSFERINFQGKTQIAGQSLNKFWDRNLGANNKNLISFDSKKNRLRYSLLDRTTHKIKKYYFNNQIDSPYFESRIAFRGRDNLDYAVHKNRDSLNIVKLETQEIIDTHPLLRNTVIPKLLLRQSVIPLALGARKEIYLFVEESSIEAEQIHLVKIDESGFTAKLKWKMFKPANCSPRQFLVTEDRLRLALMFYCSADRDEEGNEINPARLIRSFIDL